MARYTRFEELPVWQTAARLYNAVLDLVDKPGFCLSGSFRSQLERAALSVSNNIAEGFERATTAELLNFIAIARGSAGEVRSMILVVSGRPRLGSHRSECEQILDLALSCLRQLTAWTISIEDSDIAGNRRLTRRKPELKER
ncbi:MAG: hypothetical protein RIS76_3926 [Verrucomicrobiota bacterium]